ncbi:MAG: K+-transporting ATPase [Holophagaceae bacterium]|nr:K+-transporting ATPase [Holophagaceae bacterium]
MKLIRPLLVSFGALTLITGAAYPAVVTGLARMAFPWKSQGSLIRVQGQVRGSRLIAQATEDPRYFWCRPSSTSTFPTNAAASGGSTLAGSNPELAALVARRVQVLRTSDPGNRAPIPQDLVTASASGLDPDISPDAARWQAPRIARVRGLAEGDVLGLVNAHLERRLAGPPCVNVLELNLALESLGKAGE